MPKRKRVHTRAYYKPEPFPLELDELNLNAKTKSSLNVKIAAQKDTTLKRFDKVKTPNLVVLADFQNGKIYLKRACMQYSVCSKTSNSHYFTSPR